TTIDLTARFDDPSTTGQIARFEFADNINNGGTVDVLLFDQSGVGAPATVENFLNYVEDGDYDDTIIHRSVANFIVQGGGFAVENSQVVELPADEAVVNEFSPERSNLEGTIAMAKLGGDPDSATNQWFFNLGDNSANLDNQNGGFTVFGQVLDESELESIEAINALEFVNGVPVLDSLLTLDNVPITDTAAPINTDDFVGLESVSLVSEDELEFSIVSNSNEELLEASITDGELSLDYADGEFGEATITLEATNLLGESVEEAFTVTVEENFEPIVEETSAPDTVEEDFEPIVEETSAPDTFGSEIFRFLDPDTGIHFYVNSAAERDDLIVNEPDYIAEDLGYTTVESSVSDAQSVFSFFNQDTGAYLYTVDQKEKEFIEDNLNNYSRESDS
ncbi:MAG: peptidylprolyl isomerase, partial [Cyanobacteria bacterium J06649_11]